MFDKERNISAVIETLEGRTEIQRAREFLEESEKVSALFFEQVHLFPYRGSKEKRDLWNMRERAPLRVPAKEALGKRLEDLIYPPKNTGACRSHLGMDTRRPSSSPSEVMRSGLTQLRACLLQSRADPECTRREEFYSN